MHFVQDNESKSAYGVLRGLHFQIPPYAQSKLARCVRGAVLDVAVDTRKGSPTYGQWVSCPLCARDNEGERIAKLLKNYMVFKSISVQGDLVGLQFFIPYGFAHGFSVLTETAVFQYKCDNFYHPEAEGAIAWDDPDLAIDWYLPAKNVLLSEKGNHHGQLRDLQSPFDFVNIEI